MPQPPIMPLVNGKAHSWADVRLNVMGTTIIGIVAIKYKQEREKEDNYGAGSYPVNRGYGNAKATASITVYADVVNVLESIAPEGDITKIPPFDIPVTFLPDGGLLTTHIIKNAEFTEDGRDMKQGDKKIEVELPLITSHVKYK